MATASPDRRPRRPPPPPPQGPPRSLEGAVGVTGSSSKQPQVQISGGVERRLNPAAPKNVKKRIAQIDTDLDVYDYVAVSIPDRQQRSSAGAVVVWAGGPAQSTGSTKLPDDREPALGEDEDGYVDVSPSKLSRKLQVGRVKNITSMFEYNSKPGSSKPSQAFTGEFCRRSKSLGTPESSYPMRPIKGGTHPKAVPIAVRLLPPEPQHNKDPNSQKAKLESDYVDVDTPSAAKQPASTEYDYVDVKPPKNIGKTKGKWKIEGRNSFPQVPEVLKSPSEDTPTPGVYQELNPSTAIQENEYTRPVLVTGDAAPSPAKGSGKEALKSPSESTPTSAIYEELNPSTTVQEHECTQLSVSDAILSKAQDSGKELLKLMSDAVPPTAAKKELLKLVSDAVPPTAAKKGAGFLKLLKMTTDSQKKSLPKLSGEYEHLDQSTVMAHNEYARLHMGGKTAKGLAMLPEEPVYEPIVN